MKGDTNDDLVIKARCRPVYSVMGTGLICIAWLVSDHQLNRSMWTLGLAAVLTILTYMSLAKDAQQRSDEK